MIMSAKKTSQAKKAESVKVKKAAKAIEVEAAATTKPAPVTEALPIPPAHAKTKAPIAKAEPKQKKVSALDAAAKVLVEQGKPMNCQEMIDEMSRKKYWTSAKGLTPHATLYAAILREIKVKGKDARFQKTERGKFASAAG
jgi:vancomycin resistance protein YoaR